MDNNDKNGTLRTETTTAGNVVRGLSAALVALVLGAAVAGCLGFDATLKVDGPDPSEVPGESLVPPASHTKPGKPGPGPGWGDGGDTDVVDDPDLAGDPDRGGDTDNGGDPLGGDDNDEAIDDADGRTGGGGSGTIDDHDGGHPSGGAGGKDAGEEPSTLERIQAEILAELDRTGGYPTDAVERYMEYIATLEGPPSPAEREFLRERFETFGLLGELILEEAYSLAAWAVEVLDRLTPTRPDLPEPDPAAPDEPRCHESENLRVCIHRTGKFADVVVAQPVTEAGETDVTVAERIPLNLEQGTLHVDYEGNREVHHSGEYCYQDDEMQECAEAELDARHDLSASQQVGIFVASLPGWSGFAPLEEAGLRVAYERDQNAYCPLGACDATFEGVLHAMHPTLTAEDEVVGEVWHTDIEVCAYDPLGTVTLCSLILHDIPLFFPH